MSQVMMSTDPLYRTPLLLLLEQRVRAKVRRLMQRRRMGLIEILNRQMLGHRLF